MNTTDGWIQNFTSQPPSSSSSSSSLDDIIWVPYLSVICLVTVLIGLVFSFYSHMARVMKRRSNARDYLEHSIDLRRKRLFGMMRKAATRGNEGGGGGGAGGGRASARFKNVWTTNAAQRDLMANSTTITQQGKGRSVCDYHGGDARSPLLPVYTVTGSLDNSDYFSAVNAHRNSGQTSNHRGNCGRCCRCDHKNFPMHQECCKSNDTPHSNCNHHCCCGCCRTTRCCCCCICCVSNNHTKKDGGSKVKRSQQSLLQDQEEDIAMNLKNAKHHHHCHCHCLHRHNNCTCSCPKQREMCREEDNTVEKDFVDYRQRLSYCLSPIQSDPMESSHHDSADTSYRGFEPDTKRHSFSGCHNEIDISTLPSDNNPYHPQPRIQSIGAIRRRSLSDSTLFFNEGDHLGKNIKNMSYTESKENQNFIESDNRSVRLPETSRSLYLHQWNTQGLSNTGQSPFSPSPSNGYTSSPNYDPLSYETKAEINYVDEDTCANFILPSKSVEVHNSYKSKLETNSTFSTDGFTRSPSGGNINPSYSPEPSDPLDSYPNSRRHELKRNSQPQYQQTHQNRYQNASTAKDERESDFSNQEQKASHTKVKKKRTMFKSNYSNFVDDCSPTSAADDSLNIGRWKPRDSIQLNAVWSTDSLTMAPLALAPDGGGVSSGNKKDNSANQEEYRTEADVIV